MARERFLSFGSFRFVILRIMAHPDGSCRTRMGGGAERDRGSIVIEVLFFQGNIFSDWGGGVVVNFAEEIKILTKLLLNGDQSEEREE